MLPTPACGSSVTLDSEGAGMLLTTHTVNNSNQNITSGRSRNPSDFLVLGVLYREPAHGYDICRELKKYMGEIWRLRTSHVYALLANLQKDGLVRHDRVDQETRPAKKVFSTTNEGQSVFLNWLRTPVSHQRDIRLEFLAKLHFTRFYSPGAVAKLIENQLEVCRTSLERLNTKIERCETDTERSSLDFRLTILQATESWLIKLQSQDPAQSEGA